jgi:hypothetical protein
MGIDGGGVFKEFFTDLSKEVFDSDRGLWLVNKKNELYPNHGSYATQRKHFPNVASFTVSKFSSFKRIVSTGTGLSAESWARHFTRVSWWMSHLPASSLPKFAYVIWCSVASR